MHPLFRFLLVLRVTSRIGQARACLPLHAQISYVKGMGYVHSTFLVIDCMHASVDKGSCVDQDTVRKVLLQFKCAHTCMQTFRLN